MELKLLARTRSGARWMHAMPKKLNTMRPSCTYR